MNATKQNVPVRLRRAVIAALATAAAWIAPPLNDSYEIVGAEAERPAAEATPEGQAVPEAKRPDPKPLSDQVNKGLAWLVKHQQEDGGWNQGEAGAEGGRGGEVIDKSNVGDTCMAALTLMRAGSTPKEGEHAANLLKAAGFVCGEVERGSNEGLLVTDIKPTRLQSKLGQFVDTFAAALFLAEVRNDMPDEASAKRVMAALDKVMDKIEKNQKEDGRWVDADDGWAGALCQSLGHKALNRAAQQGHAVGDEVLAKAEKFALKNFDAERGEVDAAGSAGVELYARASNLGAFQESAKTNAGKDGEYRTRRDGARRKLQRVRQQLAQAESEGDADAAAEATVEVTKAADEVASADERLESVAANAKALKQAQQAVVQRLDDKDFVAGFGSNGGEEFLSYMNIGESLLLKGGEEFAKWDEAMTGNLNRVQNDDGSWSGHHCITGRTFCTASALLTLMVDRSSPAPVAAKIEEAGR